jgi:enamine deaminase RidA (YjgF/YER057c/UK114 family)
MHIKVETASPYAKTVGYARAVRVGSHISVAGTASIAPDGSVYAPGDAYAQAKKCLEIIEQSLVQLGAKMDDVVRTRMFVKRRELWQEVGRAHGEFFSEIRPATSMLFCDLIDEEMLVEIEADAVVAG